MAYHEVTYLFLFLPLVLIAYQIVPQKRRWCVLLLAGYAFFWSFSKSLVLVLMATSMFTHYIGLWLERVKEDGDKKKQKWILFFGVFVLLAVLGYLKYANFFVENVNGLLTAVGKSGMALETEKIAVPIGISFYTLQAIGYMGGCLLGQDPGRTTSWESGTFPRLFPADHGRTHCHVFPDSGCTVEWRKPEIRKSGAGIYPYPLGTF